MNWQDLVFSVGGWILAIFLIPTIRGKQKPELATSLITSIILFIFVISYFSLGLKMGALATLASATCWGILAYQRFVNDRKSRH
ncbi:MAG TPA: hypothetical protein VLE91_04870 [Candidatus Saccharimonadales bacterium]|nr:hypothetical protein [Candidatus Saccharimonadales bacterium]